MSAALAGCWADDEPVIGTFEFPYKEFVCVVCGATYGYLEPKRLEPTPARLARHDELRERYRVERAQREAARA